MGLLRAPAMRVPRSKPMLSDGQEGFTGYNSDGLYTRLNANDIALMNNVRVLRDGSVAKRPGMVGVANNITGQFPLFAAAWNRATAGGEIIVSGGASGSGKVYKVVVTGNAGATTSLSTTSVLHTGAAHFRDGTAECLYMACGSGKLSKWDGTTFSDRSIGLTLNLKYVWVYNQRLFGVTASDQTLYWSGLNNGDSIGDTTGGGGSATVRTYGGAVLVGGFALGSSNILLHRNAVSIFRGTTFDDINITAGVAGHSPTLGAVSERGYTVVGDTGYMMTTEGLAVITEAGVMLVKETGIIDPCADDLRQFPANGARVSMAYNVRAEELWIWTGGGTTGNGTCSYYIYRPIARKFTGHSTGIGGAADDAQQFVAAYLNTGAPQFLVNNNGALYGFDFVVQTGSSSYEKYDDVNSAYNSFFRCRRLFTSDAKSEKAWRWLYVTMGQSYTTFGVAPVAAGTDSKCKVTYQPVGGSSVTQSTPTILSERVNILPLSGTGPAIDITITDASTSNTSQGWRCTAVSVEGASLGERGG